ncbi:UDP-N-acetylenolpyruvoylglucosamine reductase [Alicyclobacillus contaminans]|uniref:UDP-N-acetylmuramate dehydrogenase n=1 Tax=Alicyclobacillus contaminans TaxID=392016 RepID=UPI000414F525|nr:UDP-N-acetylmuramate dehydrogenase [Alicyclobacillus contaminans]GMA49167.1 UDP-N-acetylenolpyruvoylglucosamine reductase [Alicyclobacillus contaminans]
MNSERVLAALERFGVQDVRLNEPMSRHTTWRIGGPADIFVCPKSVSEVRGALLAARELEVSWTVIGRGSNLLVQDGGIRGMVIKMGDNLAKVDVDGETLTAEAGRSFVSAANLAIRHGLSGLEFATGIPGSVGGAVMMNAGAHGGEVKDVLLYADVMDDEGRMERLSNADLRFAYRYSVLKDHPRLVLKAAFGLRPGDVEAMTRTVRGWSQRRSQTQPLSWPNCGSVFRNPPGTHAGFLIESAGLKGLRRGNAQISEKHANFIVNLGSAKAEDVLWLMRHVQETIQEKYGIHLETEVRLMGEPASGR